jgi:hypothetical protein
MGLWIQETVCAWFGGPGFVEWEGDGQPHSSVPLGLEAAVFIAAALIHFGVVMDGYNDQEAGTAESVLAIVLLAGLLTSLLRPDWTRRAGILVQGFALVGTFVGLTSSSPLAPAPFSTSPSTSS